MTAIVEPGDPGFQVYVLAPDAEKVVVLPEQIVIDEGAVDIVGVAFTETVAIAEFVQPPNVLVPVMV